MKIITRDYTVKGYDVVISGQRALTFVWCLQVVILLSRKSFDT